jgi:hypothetical protein
MMRSNYPRPLIKVFVPAAFVMALLMALSGTARGQSQWTTNGSNVSSTNDGNVGIGTATPVDKLEVSDASPNAVSMRVTNTDATGAFKYGQFSQLGTSGWGIPDWANAFLIEGTANGGLVLDSYAAPLRLQTGRVTRLTVDHVTGNVGIGTSSPATKLHVVGDVTVTGNLNAKYQDLAEWVPSLQKLQAGTVVVLDTQLSNHVEASSRPYEWPALSLHNREFSWGKRGQTRQ